MQWTQLNDYCLISSCNRYSVTKIYCGERIIYSAWGNKELLGDFKTAEEAKEKADKDSFGKQSSLDLGD